MHRNPVRVGLITRPCDWPWGSARDDESGRSVGVPVGWLAWRLLRLRRPDDKLSGPPRGTLSPREWCYKVADDAYYVRTGRIIGGRVPVRESDVLEGGEMAIADTVVGSVAALDGVLRAQLWTSWREREAREHEVKMARERQWAEFQFKTLLGLQDALDNMYRASGTVASKALGLAKERHEAGSGTMDSSEQIRKNETPR